MSSRESLFFNSSSYSLFLKYQSVFLSLGFAFLFLSINMSNKQNIANKIAIKSQIKFALISIVNWLPCVVAIIVLKKNIKIKEFELQNKRKTESTTEKKEQNQDYIIKEAEMIINNYCNKIENNQKKEKILK